MNHQTQPFRPVITIVISSLFIVTLFFGMSPTGPVGNSESIAVTHEGESVFADGVYDNTVWLNGRMQLFGNAWFEQQSTGPVPSSRHGHAMAYDSVHQKVVLFGGYDGYKYYSDTWVYDVQTNAWSLMQPASTPRQRTYHAMVYDSVNDVMVMFGGKYGIDVLGDTWTYSLATNTWTEKNPATDPEPRQYHAMAFDEGQGLTVLYGGTNTNVDEFRYDDTWTYNTATDTWTNRTAVSGTFGIYGSAMAYDIGANKIVMMGGNYYSTQFNYDYAIIDTLTLSGPTYGWTSADPPFYPQGRQYHHMVYDDLNDAIVMFGGKDESSPNFDDTWLYDTAAEVWTQWDGPHPASTNTHPDGAMVYDTANDVTVMFYKNSIWLFSPRYRASGTYTSGTIDAGSAANTHWQRIAWSPGNSLQPSGTSVKFQVATNNDGVTWNYVGPDGTASSYYTTPDQSLWSGHTGNRYLRYKAFFSTTDTMQTPTLNEVTVTYQRAPPAPSVRLTSPNGGEDWLKDDDYPIIWECTGGELAEAPITLEYSTDSGESWTEIATNLENTGYYTWTVPNTGNTPSALIRITATDIHGNTYFDTSDATFAIDPPAGTGIVPGEAGVDGDPTSSGSDSEATADLGTTRPLSSSQLWQMLAPFIVIIIILGIVLMFLIVKHKKQEIGK